MLQSLDYSLFFSFVKGKLLGRWQRASAPGGEASPGSLPPSLPHKTSDAFSAAQRVLQGPR